MAILTENTYIDLVIAFTTVFIAIKLYFNRSFNYWKSKGIKTLPPTFPFGNATDLILQRISYADVFRNYYHQIKNKGLKYGGFYMFSRPQLFVVDPELIKSILTKDFQHFTGRDFYANEKVDPLSSQLLTLDGLEWKRRRSQLSPTFTSGKMKMMFETLFKCTTGLKSLMDDASDNDEVLDVKEILERFTTDVIGSCAFGLECNSLKNPNSEFRIYGKESFDEGTWGMFKIVLSMLAPSILNIFKIPRNNPSVTKFFINTVKETVRYREENNVLRKDFMHLLIQLKNNVRIADGDNLGELKGTESRTVTSLTEKQIAAEAFLFFTAGFESSAAVLTFCLYELALNEDVQEKLRSEIQDVLEKYDGKLTYDAIMEMAYMDKCINETLRKYPPFPTTQRLCNKPYRIPNSDVIIEKGILIPIPIIGIHYDEQYHPNPYKFDPERFSQENKLQRHPYSWIPFGEGPRICFGMRFALMQVKVGLSVLLGDYKFSLNSKTVTPIIFDPKSFIVSAKGRIWLNVKKIK